MEEIYHKITQAYYKENNMWPTQNTFNEKLTAALDIEKRDNEIQRQKVKAKEDKINQAIIAKNEYAKAKSGW